MTDTDTDDVKVASLSDWKKNKTHTVTLPSGTAVEIQIPDLPGLVKAGTIPNELVEVAIAVSEGEKKVTRDDIIKQSDFYNALAALTVTKPTVTEEDFSNGALPFEDKEMIVEFATRQRDIDAIGHHIGGLEKVRDWKSFRSI